NTSGSFCHYNSYSKFTPPREIIFIDNIRQDCYNKINLRETLGMSLVMQAKPKSAELILVFLI
uniref:hypothetical protein n=1 Tax=Mediterraneibacter sp. TaxID=2316022 RepID=UPI0027B9E4E7